MEMRENLKEAVLWKTEDQKIRCFLCSWRCLIPDGAVGRCRVRKHVAGILYSLVYDKVTAAAADPIEKKPLFHFHPGSHAFSIATPGCNFQCSFCQNWQISQLPAGAMLEGSAYTPAQIVEAAIGSNCSSIAYTYTEPTIFMELCADTARLARQKGLKNVFVSNGFMTPEAIDFAKDWLDAINIDIKAFSEEFYHELCRGRLEPVLEAIRYIAHQTDIWMELTTLIIPGKNDSDDELRSIAEFIAKEASVDVPWHISRFYPQYKMTAVSPTRSTTLQRAFDIGKEAGLHYIYIGNMPGMGAESTTCYKCGEVLIERVGYHITRRNLERHQCPQCGTQIAGVQLA